MSKNLDKYELQYYFNVSKYIGENNLLHLLVPILLKYEKDFYIFYRFSVLDDSSSLDTWIKTKVKDTTDRKLLLKFKRDIFKGVRKDK